MKKILIFTFSFFVFSLGVANAATLYFSPSSGNFSVGDLLNTSVLVNTESTAINQSDAVINFPSALLEVVSLSKSGSIFTLWVEEPAFSNSAGTVTYNGGLPTPGFNGGAGRILSITFRVRNSGTASVLFSAGAVRANDGFGTDVLKTREPAQFNLVSAERPIVPLPTGVPQAPRVSSPTHPDSNQWYARSTAVFTWPVLAGVDAARLLVGSIPTATPVVLYVPAVDQKTVENMEDGVWYFHAQLRNDAGWGEITHYKFQVDTTPPERFDITLAPREDPTDPRVKLVFDAYDATSGIDYYEVQIDGKEPLTWRDDGTKTFETPPLGPGSHILTAKAVDKAGNFLADSIEFTVEPLDSPRITEYPKELEAQEMLVVRGETYPNADVTVWVQRSDETPTKHAVRSDGAGGFTFVLEEGLDEGVYGLSAEVTDHRGAKSDPSEPVTVVVKEPAFFKIGKLAVGVLSVVTPLIAILVLLILLILRAWYMFVAWRRKIRKEVREAERALHKAFDLLKEDVREQIKMLEEVRTRRDLTEEEERVIRQLQKDLDDAERFVGKEIEDIEKEVK